MFGLSKVSRDDDFNEIKEKTKARPVYHSRIQNTTTTSSSSFSINGPMTSTTFVMTNTRPIQKKEDPRDRSDTIISFSDLIESEDTVAQKSTWERPIIDENDIDKNIDKEFYQLCCRENNAEVLLKEKLLPLQNETSKQLLCALVNTFGENGQSVLYGASIKNRPNVVRLLLDCGACVDMGLYRVTEEDIIYGQCVATPLLAAAADGLDSVGEILLKYGAKVNETGGRGRTALHLASFGKGKKSTVLLLKKFGASNDIRDEMGKKPSDLCIDNDIISILTQ